MGNGDEKETFIRRLIVNAALLVEAYFVADQMTHGTLSEALKAFHSHLTKEAKKRAEYRKDVGNMLWQALETLEGAE